MPPYFVIYKEAFMSKSIIYTTNETASAVAVGDLIAQAGAQAQTLGLLGNGVEGAGDLTERCV